MNHPSDFPGCINMGNPVEYTIRDLADKVIEIVGSTSKTVFKSLPQDDPKRRCPDIRLAKEVLNWEIGISLEEGLQKTVQYFREPIFGLEILNVKSTT